MLPAAAVVVEAVALLIAEVVAVVVTAGHLQTPTREVELAVTLRSTTATTKNLRRRLSIFAVGGIANTTRDRTATVKPTATCFVGLAVRVRLLVEAGAVAIAIAG